MVSAQNQVTTIAHGRGVDVFAAPCGVRAIALDRHNAWAMIIQTPTK